MRQQEPHDQPVARRLARVSPDLSSTAVVIPIKGFNEAKHRLAPMLDPAERTALAMTMARRVIAAAEPLPVFVACDKPAIVEWAQAEGCEPLLVPANGLNEAVSTAVGEIARLGFETVVVAHGDLPLAHELAHLVDPLVNDVVLVPDRRADGTNVVVTPTENPISFAYGPGSFHRHVYSAARAPYPVRIVRDVALGWDIDEPNDLELPDGTSAIDLLCEQSVR